MGLNRCTKKKRMPYSKRDLFQKIYTIFKHSFIRTLLSIAAMYDLELQQLDVNTAVLHDVLSFVVSIFNHYTMHSRNHFINLDGEIKMTNNGALKRKDVPCSLTASHLMRNITTLHINILF